VSKTSCKVRFSALLALGCVAFSLAAQGCRAKQASQTAAPAPSRPGAGPSQQENRPNFSLK